MLHNPVAMNTTTTRTTTNKDKEFVFNPLEKNGFDIPELDIYGTNMGSFNYGTPEKILHWI